MRKEPGLAFNKVRFRTKAVPIAATIPRPYRPSSTAACWPRNGPKIGRCGIKAAIRSAYTGNLAEHVMNGVIKIVAILSRSSSTVRAARIAGIAQA